MSLAAAFAKPHAFVPPVPGTGPTIGDDELGLIGDLIRVFVQNPQLGRTLADRMVPVLITELRYELVNREEQARQAFGKARNLFSPLENHISTLISTINTDLLETIPAVLELARAVVDGLSSENVKAFASSFWDLALDDLNISGTAIKDLVRRLFDQVIQVFENDYAAGARDDEAVALKDFSIRVDSLKIFVLDEMQIPAVEKQFLLNAIDQAWQTHDLDATLNRIKEFLDSGQEVVTPVTHLAQCIIQQLKSNSGATPGNAAPVFSRGPDRSSPDLSSPDRSAPNFSGPNLESSDSNDTVTAWYASWVSGKNVSYSEDTAQAENIYENPELRGFTYKHISRETMEAIAFHTAWITPALECIPHLISVEKGDVASNAANIMWNFGEAFITGVAKIDFPRWAQWLGLPVLTTLGGLESHESRWSWGDDPYVIINILGDYGEVYTYRRYAWTVREGLLSILTLINNDPDQAQQWRDGASDLSGEEKETAWDNRNNNCFPGTCYLFGELMTLLLPGILSATDKKNYGFVGGGPAKQFW